MSFTKKLMVYMVTAVAAVILTASGAFACTMVYVGSDYSDDGSSFVCRSEDYSNSYNKVAYVAEHGKHLQGEVYNGCYGFTHTFSHDSYSYTSVSDDNLVTEQNPTGICPNCDNTHEHTPMEEAGTNEKGVSVSAMDTIYANSAVRKACPMVGTGIAESDMATVILCEAASAKEGVELLLNIYETQGAMERSGVQIADNKEVWYVENYTGSSYIAIKLSPSMIAMNPNVGAIGLIDLDDTENVIASANLIESAKTAGTFVGDEAENIIDVFKSFSSSASNPGSSSRLVNGLNYFAGENCFDKSNVTAEDFVISNVKDGGTVTMYTNIKNSFDKINVDEVIGFFKVKDIGKSGNLEWHIFQINPNLPLELGTIEWLGMNHAGYTPAIPYYPMLTTEMYEGYYFSAGTAKNASAAPESLYGCYPNGSRYKLLPTGWENGYYWSVDMLSNYAESSLCSAEDKAMILAAIDNMQQECYDVAAQMKQELSGMSLEAAKVYATDKSEQLAKQTHEMSLALYKHAFSGEHAYTDILIESTCTEGGHTVHQCVCGDSYIDSETPVAEHTWENGVCIICDAQGEKCAAPTVTAGNAKSGKVTLKWNAVEGAEEYIVYRAGTLNGEYTKMFTTKNTSYTNTVAKVGATYFYKVVAVAASEDMQSSDASAAVKQLTKCAAPVVTAGNAKSGKVTLKWNAVEGAKEYVIYRAGTENGQYTKMFTTKNTSYTNTVSKAGATYFYKVVAVCSSSAGNAESTVVKGTVQVTAPAIKAQVGKAYPSIKWNAVDGAKQYIVYRSVDDGAFTKFATVSKLSFTNISASKGHSYSFKLVAVAESGKLSPASNVISFSMK